MEHETYLQLLNRDGTRLSRTAAQDLTASVPSCPGWDVQALVRHTAEVYEHKLACIALGGTRPHPWPPEWPEDDVLAWFDDAHGRLLQTLRTVDPAAPSWTWWPPDQTAGFWVRRMAQETAVHRVDAELSFGDPTPVDRALALDGIDELLHLMFAGDWTGDEQPDLTGTVAVAAPDRSWTIRMRPEAVAVEDSRDQAVDATVAAEPSPLLLWLYGRAPDGVVTVCGDAQVSRRLRERLALATQ